MLGKPFFAGFMATLLFHQVLLALLVAGLDLPVRAFDFSAVPPLEVPKVLSLAFWGGVWGIPIWWFIQAETGPAYWLRGIIAGALGPSGVALFLVMPLKGMPVAAGWDAKVIVGALLLNAAWGMGLALIMRLIGTRAEPMDRA